MDKLVFTTPKKALRESVDPDKSDQKRKFIIIPREKPSQADLDNTTISELEDENAALQEKVKELSGKNLTYRKLKK